MVENHWIIVVVPAGITPDVFRRNQYQWSRILATVNKVAGYYPVMVTMVIHVDLQSNTLRLITDVLDTKYLVSK